MERPDVQRGIGRAWRLTVELELGETISSAAPLDVNGEFRDVALDPNASYPLVYRTGLRLSHYNFMLTDLAFFQFSHSSPEDVRYAYYPNPYVTDRSAKDPALIDDLRFALEAEELNSEEYLSVLSEVETDVRAPLIRYENAPKAYSELRHPCSHFHIGHNVDNRWAVNRVLSPLAFTMLVLKHYYAPSWDARWTELEGKLQNTLEQRLISEKTGCHPVAPEMFSELEKRSFFFS